MKLLNLKALDKRAMYRLLTSAVVPRPIALVTTKSQDGSINVAPFSYFNVVTTEPPRLHIVVGRDKKTNERKDTSRHILATKRFVIQAVTEANLVDANQSAKRLSPHQSELDITGFTPITRKDFPVPYMKESPVAFDCELDRTVVFETSEMFIGRVVGIRVDEACFTGGQFDIINTGFIGRLSGNSYATLGKVIDLERP